MKEIKIRVLCDEEEYQSKLGNIIRFLRNGEQVKLIAMFRGREMAHAELGVRLLEQFVEDLKEYGTAAPPPVMEGRQMPLVFTSKIVKE